MIDMQILFFVAEIGTSKSKNLIFHVIFFNKDISVVTLDITMKFSMTALGIHFEGNVSQIFHLVFILCELEKNVLKIFKKSYPIFEIK